jgi:signal transduction histidine kinase
MNTIHNITTERVDDTPLLIEEMKRMELPTLIDQHFLAHGNWYGLSMGWVSTVWLSSIISQGGLVVTAQSLGLKRLFANLIQNALKYGACARISLRREAGAVIVDIEDDGPGVPADQREAVFKPFFRLDPSRNPNTGGVGLGLAIARDIVLSHGGDIQLHDSPAGGLRVLIRLPC